MLCSLPLLCFPLVMRRPAEGNKKEVTNNGIVTFLVQCATVRSKMRDEPRASSPIVFSASSVQIEFRTGNYLHTMSFRFSPFIESQLYNLSFDEDQMTMRLHPLSCLLIICLFLPRSIKVFLPSPLKAAFGKITGSAPPPAVAENSSKA